MCVSALSECMAVCVCLRVCVCVNTCQIRFHKTAFVPFRACVDLFFYVWDRVCGVHRDDY